MLQINALNKVVRWLRQNLFSSPSDTVLTILSIYIVIVVVPPVFEWALIKSVWLADSRNSCWEKMATPGEGACWAFIAKRINMFIYGFYPEHLHWRVNLTFVLLILAFIPIFVEKLPYRKYLLLYSISFPFLAGWFLVGGLGLEQVTTDLFGGIMLTIIIGVTGIAFSLPIGILLALGRTSNLPAVKMLCVVFIEFMRGIPLIVFLFIASTMLNYFLPPGTSFDLLLRVLIMVTLFSAAYLAEVIRGGLAGIPVGQYEASQAIGLSYWKTHRLIVMPQVLKISIPGIVNSFIGLYKDTVLVVIIGLLDPLGIGRASLADMKWGGLHIEVYIFIAIFFFICCFSMSRYSIFLEKRLNTDHE